MPRKRLFSRCLPVAWCLLLAAPGLAWGQVSCQLLVRNLPGTITYNTRITPLPSHVVQGAVNCQGFSATDETRTIFVQLLTGPGSGRGRALNAGGDRNRYMVSDEPGNDNRLSYNIYRGFPFTDDQIAGDANFGAPLTIDANGRNFGNDTHIVVTGGSTEGGSRFSLRLFDLLIHPQQRVPPGIYRDTVIVTVHDFRPGSAFQALGQTSLAFTVHVAESCSFSTAGISLNFGNYVPGQDRTVSTAITVTCDEGSEYRITADNGDHSDGSGFRMKDNDRNSYLRYDLYRDMDSMNIWGGADNSATGTGTGNAESHVILGRIQGDQRAAPGVYRDQVVFSVVID